MREESGQQPSALTTPRDRPLGMASWLWILIRGERFAKLRRTPILAACLSRSSSGGPPSFPMARDRDLGFGNWDLGP